MIDIPLRVDMAGLCAPRSVAVIGASEDDRKFGGRILKYLIKHQFAGRIIPINPKAATMFGRPSFPTVLSAGIPVDVAIMALPAEQIETSIADCAAAGVKFAIIISANFAEVGADGIERQKRILEIAQLAGMRVLGPNCLGLIAPGAKLALTPSVSMERDDLPVGGIGLISQSGALMASMFDYGAVRGISFSLCVSVGNQADLEICDFIDFLIDDDKTRVIAIYVEGLPDPKRFLACAIRARNASKPLLITKVGRSDAGAVAARSHTASLAGSYAVFEAVCRSASVTLFDDANGMIEVANFLCNAEAYSGGGVAVFSGSGGGCAMALDRISEVDFPIAELSSRTRRSLDGLLSSTHRHLPLDLGVLQTGWTRTGIGLVLEKMLDEPDVGIGLCVLTTQPLMQETIEETISVSRQIGKPVIIVILAGKAGDTARAACARNNYPYFDGLDGAVRALVALLAISDAIISPPHPPATFRMPDELEGRTGTLTEHEAKQLVAAGGIKVTREIVAADISQAITAAESIGFPVALKGISRSLPHKSDIGAVKLNLRDATAVTAAFSEVEGVFASHKIAGFEGCVVQEMGYGEVELFLGAKYDLDFGSVVLIGIGGTEVELIGDIQMAAAPISQEHALRMMKQMKLWPLLNGFRGRKAVDVAAAAWAASRLSEIAAALGPLLVELDINPLLVGQCGKGVIAVDGRATLGAKP